MATINYGYREISCKIVYYGPGMSGKTTNLETIHKKVPATSRGDLTSLATKTDRTLFFDLLPLDLGTIKGFKTKFQLYTVPGQVYYNATRKLVLRGADGVVFVADSQPDRMEDNKESLANLEENMTEHGMNIDELPLILGWNKRDLPDVMTVDELNAAMNRWNTPNFEMEALNGRGVFDALRAVTRLVLEKIEQDGVR
jgi:signal recognition particle receptor subunit beta